VDWLLEVGEELRNGKENFEEGRENRVNPVDEQRKSEELDLSAPGPWPRKLSWHFCQHHLVFLLSHPSSNFKNFLCRKHALCLTHVPG
jgi:hypothetical protein